VASRLCPSAEPAFSHIRTARSLFRRPSPRGWPLYRGKAPRWSTRMMQLTLPSSDVHLFRRTSSRTSAEDVQGPERLRGARCSSAVWMRLPCSHASSLCSDREAIQPRQNNGCDRELLSAPVSHQLRRRGDERWHCVDRAAQGHGRAHAECDHWRRHLCRYLPRVSVLMLAALLTPVVLQSMRSGSAPSGRSTSCTASGRRLSATSLVSEAQVAWC
jgi:hypothetical protein